MKKKRQLKNKMVLFCCILLCSQSLRSQTIEKWFVNMPDILNPTLSKQNRMELLEYHKAGQGDSIANVFKHQAYLLHLDTLKQLIAVKNTRSSIFEMKIIKLDDSTSAVGIIRTVCAPVCMSTVEFYDTAWNLIPLGFTRPAAIEWLDINNIPAEKIDLQWAKNLMGLSFISLSFSEKDQSIVAKNNTLDFISVEDRKIIAPYVSDKTISFELKGRTWQRKP
jgi:hypothetical protein